MKDMTRTVKGDIEADVKLYETTHGGRFGPTPSDFFACILVFDGENFDARLYLRGNRPLCPGQSSKVTIRFLSPQLIRTHLQVGKNFQIRELGIIGEGVVRRVLKP